ncbi:uncharacterized protein LOC111245966 [Varroa destructor]|uniref:Uncharacterized protein n=1 Tax=Varroa destructor TaxID=109461 RepID=A0A7M7JQF9_VARDE|nr:uncharacterized protein LOC111245966 [Varroa destructor]
MRKVTVIQDMVGHLVHRGLLGKEVDADIGLPPLASLQQFLSACRISTQRFPATTQEQSDTEQLLERVRADLLPARLPFPPDDQDPSSHSLRRAFYLLDVFALISSLSPTRLPKFGISSPANFVFVHQIKQEGTQRGPLSASA